MTLPNSPPSPFSLGTNPAGFSPAQAQAARDIKARLLAGESIPLEELKLFILSSERDLTQSRKAENTVIKATDVDFF
jgi:hypothetical protein